MKIRQVFVCLQESFLLEVRHFPFAIALIESDDLGERSHRRLAPKRSQVGIQARFEFIEQNFIFGLPEFPIGWKVRRVH